MDPTWFVLLFIGSDWSLAFILESCIKQYWDDLQLFSVNLGSISQLCSILSVHICHLQMSCIKQNWEDLPQFCLILFSFSHYTLSGTSVHICHLLESCMKLNWEDLPQFCVIFLIFRIMLYPILMITIGIYRSFV